MAVGYPTKTNFATGDILTAGQMQDLSGTVNYTQYMKPWNTCLNSNMSVWQRGTSITTASAVYTADRWQAGIASAGTVSRQVTGDTTNLPNIQYCLRYQRTAASSSTSDLALSQSFETINSIPYVGKPVTCQVSHESFMNNRLQILNSNMGHRLEKWHWCRGENNSMDRDNCG